MNDTPHPTVTRGRPYVGLTVIALCVLVGAIITGISYFNEHGNRHLIAEANFNRLAEQQLVEIRRKFLLTAYGMRGARGVYAAIKTVERHEFQAYVSSRDLSAEFPGALGMGFVQRVSRADLDQFITSEQADEAPSFQIRQLGEGPSHYIVKFIEPESTRSWLEGLDFSSDPILREPAEFSMRSGDAALSAPVRIPTLPLGGEPMVLFLPVYRKDSPRSTEVDRVRNLVGWIISPINIEQALQVLPPVSEGLLFTEVFDLTQSGSRYRVFRSPGDASSIEILTREDILEIGSRKLLVHTSATPKFLTRYSVSPPHQILILGTLLTFLCTASLALLVRTRSHALHLAAERMGLLRETERMARVGGWELDLQSQKLLWSEQVYAIHEVPRDYHPEVKRAIDFYAPEARPIIAAAIERTRTTLEPWDLELPFITHKGTHLWVRASGEAVIENGICRKIRGHFQDITPQKQTEEKLRQYALDVEAARAKIEAQAAELRIHTEVLREVNSEVEAANRAKSQFLANMSHEIRTPMNAIMGMTELTLESNLNEEQRSLLATVHDSAQSLLEIINDILDLSKVEAGKLEISRAPFDLPKSIDRVMRQFDAKARSRNVRMEQSRSPTLPRYIVGDDLRVGQILINLVGNAVKFTPEGGVVRVTFSTSEHLRDSCKLRVDVSDTGVGIPPDKCHAIFEPFTQADGGTTRRFGGTGLGLTISKRLTELMGGKIWVVSRLGEGSTFSFEIPTRLVPQEVDDTLSASVPVAPPTSTTPLVTPTVLLVEDNLTNQKLAIKLLERCGCHVTVANDGLQALEILRSSPLLFAMVFMDCQMPVMDGFEATAKIREMEAPIGRRTPIIAMTANAMTGDREKCLASGMDEYLSKPIDRSLLQDIVTRYGRGVH